MPRSAPRCRRRARSTQARRRVSWHKVRCASTAPSRARVRRSPRRMRSTRRAVMRRVGRCLVGAGDDLGDWQLCGVLARAGELRADRRASQDGFVRAGGPAGEPERLVLLGHDDEGDEPPTRCGRRRDTARAFSGAFSQRAAGRWGVGSDQTEGGVRLQSFASPVSDDQGRVVVQGLVPDHHAELQRDFC